MSQSFSMGCVVLILLPSLLRWPEDPPRERTARINQVHNETMCDVTVDLTAQDARTPEDVKRLNAAGFECSLNGLMARKTSVHLGSGVGQLRWPPFVPPKKAEEKGPSFHDEVMRSRREAERRPIDVTQPISLEDVKFNQDLERTRIADAKVEASGEQRPPTLST